MKSLSLGAFIAFLIALSILNDVILFDFISLAKVISIVSIVFLLYSGVFLNKIRTADVLVVVYSVLLILNTFLLSGGEISDRTIAITVSLLIGAVFYFLVSHSKIELYKYTRAYIYVCLIGLCISFIQSLTGSFFFTNRIFLSELIPGLYRGSGFMSDPNYFGLTILMGFCLIHYSFKKNTLVLKVFFSIGIILTGSRSVLISFLLLLIAEKYGRKINAVSVILLALSLPLLIFILFYFRGYLPDSLAMVFNQESYSSSFQRNSLSDRMAAIESAIIAFKHYPISGYGLGNLVYFPLNSHGQMSHNTYLEILAESGIVGIIMFLSLIVYNVKRSLTLKKSELMTLAFLLLFVFTLMSMTLVTHYSRLFFYMLSILSIVYKEDSYEENKN